MRTPNDQQAGGFWKVSEFAQHYRISRTTAYQLVQSGEVPSVRIGGSLRIPRDELDQLMSKRSAA